MVQEIRKIILSGDELVNAYESYRRVTPDFLPEGKIRSCQTSTDGSVTVMIEISSNEGPMHSAYVLKGMDVLKPMIRFCIENNIMLPRNGRKSLSVIEGSATLQVALNMHIDLTEVNQPMRTNHIPGLTEVLPKQEDSSEA